MTDSHEILPNAPLALVVVEIRFSGMSDESYQAKLLREFLDVLGAEWVFETQMVQSQALSFSPMGTLVQVQPSIAIPRFVTREKTSAVALTKDSVTVETTKYQHYPQFREIVKRSVEAISAIIKLDGILRIGMRYINEIRVPHLANDHIVTKWSQWMHESMLAYEPIEMKTVGYSCVAWDDATEYRVGENRNLVFRYGPRSQPVVNSTKWLKRYPVPLSGPCFLWDFDCFWEPQDIPKFDPNVVISECDELRKPIRKLFDLLTTERLEVEFKKENTNGNTNGKTNG